MGFACPLCAAKLVVTSINNMPLIATVFRGAEIGDGDLLSSDLLRRIAQPSIQISGTLDGTSSLGTGTVQTANIADAAVTAVKLASSSVDLTKLALASISSYDNNDLIVMKDVSANAGAGAIGTYTRDQLEAIIYRAGDYKTTAATTAFSTVADEGWLECDGSVISRTTFARLFTAIGSTYGSGDGSTTFGIPDARGRSTVGAGTGLHSRKVKADFALSNTSLYLATGEVTSAVFGFGVKVRFSTTGSLPAPLLTNTDYYIDPLASGNGEQYSIWGLYTSRLNLTTGGLVVFTSNGSGVHTMTHTLVPRVMGEQVGNDSITLRSADMPTHSHGESLSPVNQVLSANAPSAPGVPYASGGSNFQFGSLTAIGQNADHKNVHPALVTRLLIKT